MFGEWIASDGAGEAALRADSQAIKIDIARRLIYTPLQHIQALEYWRFRADEAKHHAPVFRYEPQRREIAGARRNGR
jgi:hypothetical protein